MKQNETISILRNPYGFDQDEMREVRLKAADLIEGYAKKIQNIVELCERNEKRRSSGLVGVAEIRRCLDPTDTNNDNSKYVIREFYHKVCHVAEKNMLKTNKLEGSHFAAMTTVMKDMGVDIKKRK
jgi:hypothetical protein